MTEMIDKLNKKYFWDININDLEANKSNRIIIERVFNFGNLDDIKLIVDNYGITKIKNVVCNLNYIDPKTFNFLALFLNIPKTEFKCYTKKQLNNLHWNY